MTHDISEKTRKASIEALKVIYYVIIAIAITEALNKTFLKEGVFLGWKIFEIDNLPTIFLLLGFLPTIIRFVHGASIHLDVLSIKRFKPLVDFIGFFIQASFFYLVGISFNDPITFLYLLILILLFDALWLIILRVIRYIELGNTEIQWLLSDFIFIVILILLIILDPLIGSVCSSLLILIISVVATFLDYILNRDFYFPIIDATSANTR